MGRVVKARLAVAVWCVLVSVAYVVLDVVAPRVAEGLLVAFVALLVVPTAAIEAWWEARR